MPLVPSSFCPFDFTDDPLDFNSMDDDPFHIWAFEDVTPPTKILMLPKSHAVWSETSAAHILKVDLQGFNKNEVEVEIEHGKVIKISGQQDIKVKEKKDKWQRVERISKRFVRRLKLPVNAKVDGMKTEFENGALTITLPKEEGKKDPGRVVEQS